VKYEYLGFKKMSNDNRPKAIVNDDRPKIKIKLDYKTIITVRSMDAYKVWKDKFPEAVIIEQLS
jgi:hypothetical protein